MRSSHLRKDFFFEDQKSRKKEKKEIFFFSGKMRPHRKSKQPFCIFFTKICK